MDNGRVFSGNLFHLAIFSPAPSHVLYKQFADCKTSLKILIYTFDSPITRNVVKANSRRLSINSNIFFVNLSVYVQIFSIKSETREKLNLEKHWDSKNTFWFETLKK